MMPNLRPVCLAWLWAAPLAAMAGTPQIQLDAPRPYGYVVGDVITLRATAEVDAGYRLDARALPAPGPLRYWLVLRRLDVKAETAAARTRYRFELEYQTFYTPPTVKTLDIPALPLQFVGAAGTQQAQLPAWTFSAGPIRELALVRDGGLALLRPDAEPKPLETLRDWLLFGVCAGLAATALAYLGYLQGWLPYGRKGRAFAVACKALRSPLAEDQAFSCVHQAFNATAGKPLFAEELADFFAQHPRYLPLRTDIEAFFQASYALFFADDGAQAAAFSRDWLARLCRQCLRIERAQ